MTQLNPDDVLENAKGKMEHLLVVGVTSQGQIHMEMSRPTFEFANYILNRGIYEVNNMESTRVSERITNERLIAEQVQVEKPAKRGRPRKAA